MQAGWKHFNGYSLNMETAELRRNGAPVPIERQPALVLVRLLTDSGALVTRAELKRTVWPTDTHVDFDRGLNYCIRQIRQVLGDDARAPRFIETVPRQGYRFVADVGTQTAPVPAFRRWRLVTVAGAVAMLTAVVELSSDGTSHHQMALSVARTLHDWLF